MIRAPEYNIKQIKIKYLGLELLGTRDGSIENQEKIYSVRKKK